MKTEGSLLYSQNPTSGHYPEPDESSSHPTYFKEIGVIFSSHICLSLLICLFLSCFWPNFMCVCVCVLSGQENLSVTPTDWLTDWIHESHSSEANSHSSSQEIPCFSWNTEVYYHFHKSRLSQMHSVHTFPPYFPKIYCNITFPSMPQPSNYSLPSMLSDQNFVCMSYLYHAYYMPLLSDQRWEDKIFWTNSKHPPNFFVTNFYCNG